GQVRLGDARAAVDHRGGRKIRADHVLHQVGDRAVRLIDEQDGGVDDLHQVVRRNVGGHADGDAAGAVDQQVGEARRQYVRLFRRLVEVGREVDGLLLDVGEQLGRD